MPYHHGNLRQSLVDAALELARTGGPDAVVLRAAGRAADVSHNAAYRHFADRDDLLRAVCKQCMGRLAERMAARRAQLPDGADPVTRAWLRLEATGRAYIEFALTEPGWFRTAFGVPVDLEPLSGEDRTWERSPYEMLGDALDELVAVGALPSEHRPGAELAAWSAVHGLAALLVDGPLRDLDQPARAAAIDRVLATVSAGL